MDKKKKSELDVALASPIVETQEGHVAQGPAFQGEVPADPYGFFPEPTKENM
jgi:hypothetical protein